MSDPICPHCHVAISAHPANACLAAWVDEAVFGVQVRISDDPSAEDEYTLYRDSFGELSHYLGAGGEVVHYDSDIAAAWEVLEKSTNYYLDGVSEDGEEHGCTVRLVSRTPGVHTFCAAHAETMPLAICRAAIQAACKVASKEKRHDGS